MIKNYTTSIASEKSIAEIQKILSKHGATRIMVDYEQGDPVALCFVLPFLESSMTFRMPCRWQGVYKVLQKAEPRYRTRPQALRVSWRILKDWVDVQTSLLEAHMAEMTEIMLPFLINKEGNTMYEDYVNHRKQLTA